MPPPYKITITAEFLPVLRMANGLAAEMETLVEEFFAAFPHQDNMGEDMRLRRFLWDNKIGILRSLEALAAIAPTERRTVSKYRFMTTIESKHLPGVICPACNLPLLHSTPWIVLSNGKMLCSRCGPDRRSS
jgi:hypothetical protein